MHEGAAAEEALKLYAFACKAARGERLGIKFNPNHDEQGRFSEGEGASGGDAGSSSRETMGDQAVRDPDIASRVAIMGGTLKAPEEYPASYYKTFQKVYRGTTHEGEEHGYLYVTPNKSLAAMHGKVREYRLLPGAMVYPDPEGLDDLDAELGKHADGYDSLKAGSAIVHASGLGPVRQPKKSAGYSGTKRTSATDYIEKLKDEFGIDIDELGFDTEPPQWFLEAAFNRLEETFALDYWEGINDTTLGNIETAIKNGIEGGLSMREIADGIMDEGEEFSKSRAMNIARTEVGGALNAGHEDGIRQIGEETGLPATKVWTSVMGPTTRDTHAEADGQEVPVDDPFIVGGEEAMFPGDPALDAGERCNCQCTLISGISADELGDSDAEPELDADAETSYDPDGAKYNENHDEHGRFASGDGGDGAGAASESHMAADVFYHGTPAAHLRSILTDGIKIGAANYSETKAGHVYVANSEHEAAYWARETAFLSGKGDTRNIAVVAVRIPKDVIGKLKPDENVDPSQGSFKFKGTIKPAWIVGVKGASISRYGSLALNDLDRAKLGGGKSVSEDLNLWLGMPIPSDAEPPDDEAAAES